MGRSFPTAILSGILLVSPVGSIPAAETPAVEKAGLSAIQLVTDSTAIAPGETFTVGLYIQPLPGFHTYWKGPGIVGVATHFDWKLPEGFSVGEVQWPAPVQTKMAGINAYGYKSDTCLLVPVTAPNRIGPEQVTLSVRCGWMACSRSCHPSWHDFSLTIPVNRSGKPAPKESHWERIFEKSRATLPKPSPADWSMTLKDLAPDSFSLSVKIPRGLPSSSDEYYFYSYDLQVNSDEEQEITLAPEDKEITLTLVRPEYAPENPEAVSGVLYHPAGWTDPDTRWVEIRVPWKKGKDARHHE